MTGIIDYGAGNLQSVANALEFNQAKYKFVRSKKELMSCKRAILPGVGAFSEAMARLKNHSLDVAIKEFAHSGGALLGICLGMQLLFEKSYEFGVHEGLGLLSGDVVKFDESKFKTKLKIPQVGWNTLKFVKQNSLTKGLTEYEYLYFTHSYHVVCPDEIECARTFYGYDFVSGVCKNSIFGFQPHPEKSQKSGLKILKNFVEL